MAVRIQIDPQCTDLFAKYLQACILSDAKSIDHVKEYCMAKLVQGVMYKLETLMLKYKQSSSYKVKSIAITELEVLAINLYFSRYDLHPYLLPLQEFIMDSIRFHYPQLITVLQNQIQWPKFIEESSFAG